LLNAAMNAGVAFSLGIVRAAVVSTVQGDSCRRGSDRAADRGGRHR